MKHLKKVGKDWIDFNNDHKIFTGHVEKGLSKGDQIERVYHGKKVLETINENEVQTSGIIIIVSQLEEVV